MKHKEKSKVHNLLRDDIISFASDDSLKTNSGIGCLLVCLLDILKLNKILLNWKVSTIGKKKMKKSVG